MTVPRIVAALVRRWWILLLTLLLGAVGAIHAWGTPEVYWATTKLVLQSPSKPDEQRLGPGSSSLLALAGVLETEVNDGRSLPRAADPDVTLVDQGVNDYAQVRVPNTGGQWANNFTEASLIVEASGWSEDTVSSRIRTLIRLVEGDLASMQAGVPASEKVSILPFPSPTIQHTSGRRTLAVAVIIALSTAGGITLSLGFEGVVGGAVVRPPRPRTRARGR